jgi:hypothetical protein
MAKMEAHRVPGLGAFIRAFGCFPVRRGESDREAVRTMRRIVADGHALGLFVEGTRQRSGVPGDVQPGAAMVALQESAPIVPVAIHGTQTWKPGSRQPVSIAWGEPMTFEGLPKGGKGYKEARRRPGRDPPPVDWLVDAHGSAAGRCPARRTRAEEEPWTSPSVRSAGTVAIVGFPNVGKSTLVNRLTESRAAVVHETAGVTRDRKELLCDWNGVTVPARRHGRRRRGRPGPFGRHIAAAGARAVKEADLVLFVVDARAGVTRETRTSRRSSAPRRSRDHAREQDRRPATRPRGARVPPARAGRSGSAVGTPRPRHR